MVEIKKNFVQTYTTGSKLYAKGKLRNAWVGMAGTNSATEIAIHQTGNVGKGANAEMHGKLQVNGNTRTAGWHYTVDDKEAVQSFPHSARVYHTGTTHGHKNAIAVEICINSDGNYKKAIANAVELVKQLMQKENIGIDKVKRHYDYSGKICPAQIMDNKDGISWTDFKNMLKDDSGKKPITKPVANKPKPSPKPKKKTIDQMAAEVIAGKHGNGHVNRRKSLGISQVEYNKVRNRVNQLAGIKIVAKPTLKSLNSIAQEVIDGKWGNGNDREKRLNKAGYNADKVQAKVNQLLSGGKPAKSIDQMAREVIAGKHGNGHAQRQKSLGVDNATYKKVRARVNQLV